MRTPITLKIKFKSSSLDQFIERYSVDVSRGGIFIRTKEPLAVGTTLRFEFQLQDGSSLIGGEGMVVWNRAYDPSRTGVAPGMGVRFDKLTPESQRVLERILGEKHKRGEAQLESRFDAGVRASREAKSSEPSDPGTPLPKPAPGLTAHFGDEPTRMMDANQVSQLAEAMQQDDGFAHEQPTRRASLEEIQKAVAGHGADREAPPAPRSMVSTGSGRTGRTSEHVRLGSSVQTPAQPSGRVQLRGAGSARVTSMGMVSAEIAANALPSNDTPSGFTPSADQVLAAPPSLSTRPVTAEQAAALIAMSHSTRTPPPRSDEFAEPGATLPSIPALNGPVLPGAPPSAGSTPLFPDAASALEAALLDEVASTPTLAGVGAPPGFPALPAPIASTAPRELAAPASPSNLSLSIPTIDVEVPQESPAQPLDPQSFAPSPSVRSPEAALSAAPLPVPLPASEPAVPAVVAAPADGGARAPWLLIILVLAVAVAGTIVYALYSARRGAENPPPPPAVRPVAPVVTPPPAVKPAPVVAETKPVVPEAKPEKAAAPEAKPADGMALKVTSEPPGAKVVLAGKEIGVTPTELTGLEDGKLYEVHLSLRGYMDFKAKVKAQADLKPLAVKLTAYERVVEVLSTPKNAEVFVDGKKVGRTPYLVRKLDLSKVHTVEVRKTAYTPQTRNISDTQDFAVKNGKEVLRLEVTLDPAPKPDKAEAVETPKAPRKAEPKKKPETDDSAAAPDAPAPGDKADKADAPAKSDAPAKADAPAKSDAPAKAPPAGDKNDAPAKPESEDK